MITDQFGKKWYKGNLHTHSTNSDGRLSPEEVIGLYREEGYDFLALTDHWFMGEERQEQNMTLATMSGTAFIMSSESVCRRSRSWKKDRNYKKSRRS